MRKFSINEVKAILQQEGYSLLSKEYKGAHTKIGIECDKGHQYSARLSKFRSGHRCPECYRLRQCLNFREVKTFVEAQGYLLLSEEYKNGYTKILVECDKKHRYKVRFSNFKQGQRCLKCYGQARSAPLEVIEKHIEQEGYKLLSKEYVSNASPLLVECDRGHQYEVRWTNFQSGKRCPECARFQKCLDYEQVKNIVEAESGYKLLSTEYRNHHTKLLIECDKQHQYWSSLGYFRMGHRCSQCVETRGERALRKILKGIFSPEEIVAQDNLGFLGLQRVDFAIPALELALEYDGVQHFQPIQFGGLSEKKAEALFKECQRLDKQKERLCQENGIRLIRFRYDEPLTKQSVKQSIEQVVNDKISTSTESCR